MKLNICDPGGSEFGFKVLGLGLWDYDLRFGVYGVVKFWDLDCGFRVQSFRVWGSGLRV